MLLQTPSIVNISPVEDQDDYIPDDDDLDQESPYALEYNNAAASNDSSENSFPRDDTEEGPQVAQQASGFCTVIYNHATGICYTSMVTAAVLILTLGFTIGKGGHHTDLGGNHTDHFDDPWGGNGTL